MNTQIQIFNFSNSQVRTIVINKEIWFVAKDVCDILEHTNSRKAVDDMVDKDDVTKGYIPHPQNNNKEIEVTVINESGLYSLIFRSNLKTANTFKRWVFKEVLPSIRKTGNYIADNNHNKLLELVLENSKPKTQIENSKKTNKAIQENYNGDYRNINATIVKGVSGKLPSEWKKIGEKKGLKSKDLSSSKTVLRKIEPSLACGVSNADFCFADRGYSIQDSIDFGKLIIPLANKVLEIENKNNRLL